MQYAQEMAVAISAERNSEGTAAAKRAASLCEQVRQSSFLSRLDKPDQSPVTIADFGAQAIICRDIAQAFPNDAIVAEEDSSLLRQSPQQLANVLQFVRSLIPHATEETLVTWIDRGQGQVKDRFWTLDLIDGTKGFLRGDQYAIAIALIEQGEVKLGVIACPMFQDGCVFLAVRGQGTQVISIQTGEAYSTHVLKSPTLPQFRLIESVETSHGNPDLQRAIAQRVGLTTPPLQMDSQAKYGAIALGQAALYMRLPWLSQVHYQENIWDHAAGAIVVEEAGSTVTDMDGKALDFTAGSKLLHNRGVVASNAVLHDAVLKTIKTQTRSSFRETTSWFSQHSALSYFQSQTRDPRYRIFRLTTKFRTN
jgi:3'(2'), 5'-bisphosphate nucleotidase